MQPVSGEEASDDEDDDGQEPDQKLTYDKLIEVGGAELIENLTRFPEPRFLEIYEKIKRQMTQELSRRGRRWAIDPPAQLVICLHILAENPTIKAVVRTFQ
jgi:hypothetical protein